ncbi:Mediator of RNA polymerase II transcription subunit 4 [Ananas comosus]|uniref:Mediator of RNA polymerase II transcription subunit 4 n=1 Tax=Ananas comosus TaxID=4615 RepID=A0A199VLU5_ANACO|nr:Mediator of RNA polymerase II transcription subunit 4 [Ananas comosus]
MPSLLLLLPPPLPPPSPPPPPPPPPPLLFSPSSPPPRAQSLLLHLSSLASKLFDASPNRPFWLASYRGSFPAFPPSSSSSSTASPTPISLPSSTKELLALATSLQTHLFESVAELQEILDLQDSAAKLARDVRAKDATLLALAHKTRDAHQVLDQLLDDYADYRRRPLKKARADAGAAPEPEFALRSGLDLQEILAYAHRISYTTFAPPEHGAGLAPLRGALPPAPQDNEMRASQLYHFADLDVGVPKKPTEAKDRAAAAAAAAEPMEALMEPTPPREELPTPPPGVAIPPPLLPIAVPPGWRKGMPVELPSEIPPVPPGWKPGDPITLPLDGVAVGNKAEEPRVSGAPVPAGPPKGPEPIQVKYVQLDINPDQDEYSSDYSSEVGSSEEDDD